MSAQSVASRSRNQQRADPDDVVLARALEFSNWARANIRLVVGGAAVLLFLVAGLLWWRADRAERQERAAAEFMQLEQTVASGNAPLAARDLERYIAQFDGTEYADEARVMLARMQLQAGEPAAAIQAVDDLARRPRGNLAAQAALLMGSAQESAGQTDAAVETYLRVADQAELDYQRIDALEAAALVRSGAGQHAGAAELYARAAELAEEGTPQRSLFEMRRAEEEARAAFSGAS